MSGRLFLPIRWRIILPFVLLSAAAGAGFGWMAERRVAAQVESDARGRLARLVGHLAASGSPLESRHMAFMGRLADARIFVLDARQAVLAASVPQGELAGWKTLLQSLPLLTPAEGASVQEHAAGIDGDYLVASRGVSGLAGPAMVVAAVSRRSVEEAQHAAAGPVRLLVGLEALAAALIGIVVAASLTRPLARLAREARRIGAGDLSAPVKVETRDEIGVLAGTLDQMRLSLRKAQQDLIQAERMAVLGRLAAGLAHEIRNPLSSIRMHVQILGRKPGVEPATRDLLLAEIDRLDGVLTELLSWSRPGGLSVSDTDLGPLAVEALDLMMPQLSHRGIRVLREIAPAPLQADRDRLRQVLRNLLANARDALGTGGTVTISTGIDGTDRVFLEVADDGPGVAPEVKDRLFEPFVTGRADGTGLGLAIVKRIVEEHGGTVAAGSASPGTRLRVLLPKSRT